MSTSDHNRRGRRRKPGFLRRFRSESEGAVAVEFAFLAIPFFTFLLAIFETALVFVSQVMLDSGVDDAARLIRTGQAQFQGLDEQGFRQEVCDHAWSLIDCTDALYVDVRAFPSFQEIDLPDPLDANGNLSGNFTFTPGAEGDVVVVRVFYEMSLFTPTAWGVGLANMGSGNRLIASATTFRNEPFGGILEE